MMANKKTCRCGFWNQVQQECLYHGYGCVYDKPLKTEKEVRYIQDVPLRFFELCLKHAKTKKDKEELKNMIKQFKKE